LSDPPVHDGAISVFTFPRSWCSRWSVAGTQGCTRELWRTIKPDIALHADRNSLRQSVLTLDFKFPCPDTNEPQWTRYGENSAYAGRTQGEIYKEALEGDAWIISPQGGMTP
jgi:hypothetical protein